MVTLEHVSVDAAIRRMRIYGHDLTVVEHIKMSRALIRGNPVTYTAYNRMGDRIGTTTVTPEDFPVTLVTEVNTD